MLKKRYYTVLVRNNLTSSKNVSEFLEMWVASIQTYAAGDNGFPKIVLIGTHKDKLPVSEKKWNILTLPMWCL